MKKFLIAIGVMGVLLAIVAFLSIRDERRSGTAGTVGEIPFVPEPLRSPASLGRIHYTTVKLGWGGAVGLFHAEVSPEVAEGFARSVGATLHEADEGISVPLDRLLKEWDLKLAGGGLNLACGHAHQEGGMSTGREWVYTWYCAECRMLVVGFEDFKR